MLVKAEVIADSLAPSESRLITLQLKYPRFVHAEFMTHRVFSRNASSSRAIPVEKMIAEIETDWARPLDFRRNQRGMQAGEILSGIDLEKAFDIWRRAKDSAILHAKELVGMDVHKQYANRLLEPFAFINVVVSSTNWTNWFALRYHKMAQPEIAVLAKEMFEVIAQSRPRKLDGGAWHLPYLDFQDEVDAVNYLDDNPEIEDIFVKRSAAKCARVSYNNHDGKRTTVEEDLKLYDRLLKELPIHASPAEHQAMAVGDPEVKSGNFRGWIQYRKTIKGENITQFSPGMYDKK